MPALWKSSDPLPCSGSSRRRGVLQRGDVARSMIGGVNRRFFLGAAAGAAWGTAFAAGPRLVGAAIEAAAAGPPRLVRVLADGGGSWRVERSDLPRPLDFVAAGPASTLWLAARDGTLLRVEADSGRMLGPSVALASELNGMPVTALTIAADGTHALVATGDALLLLNSAGGFVKRIALPAPAAAIAASAARRSFVVTLAPRPELWEISHNPQAEEFYEGLVHDFRMGEGVPTRGYLNPRRINLEAPLPTLALDARGMEAWGGTQVVNLDVRRRIAELPLAAAQRGCTACAAHPAARIVWIVEGGGTALAAFDAATPDAAAPLARFTLPGPLLGPLRFGAGGRAVHALWRDTSTGRGGVFVIGNGPRPALVRRIELDAPRDWLALDA